MAGQVCNLDETNIDFDPAPHSTFRKISGKSARLQANRHPGRYTVMLGCTISGVKLPAFIIWKGVWDGRIHRD